MADNNLTPEQEILTREFYQNIASDKSLFADDPVGHRNMMRIILTLLNYDYVDGAYITKGTKLTRYLTGKSNVTCEWEEDTLAALEALNGDNSSSTDQTDSSEPPEDSEIREAVLREDV